jgi:hypothetical protein
MNFAVTQMPRLLLRLEGLAVLLGSLLAYRLLGNSWLLFAALLLVPDLSMLAYLAGPRWGAIGYNAIHTYLAPGLLVGAMGLRLIPVFWQVPLIWLFHIGLDRALAFGLKHPMGFRYTHLSQPGAGASAA